MSMAILSMAFSYSTETPLFTDCLRDFLDYLKVMTT